MIKNLMLLKIIIAMCTFAFSTIAVAEVTVSETSIKSLSPVVPIFSSTKSLAAVDCIKDDAITTIELTKTRDNGPFSVSTKHVSRQSANGFGGGALRLATKRSTVQAIIAQTPYHDKNYGAMNTPALFIACENDRIAPNKKHTNTFYQKADGPKMKVEINNGSHFCASHRFNEKLLSKPAIAWMQRYINGDTRFDKFLCGNENYKDDSRISAYDYEGC